MLGKAKIALFVVFVVVFSLFALYSTPSLAADNPLDPGGGGGGGGTGGTGGAATCNPTCSGNQTCANGYCYPIYTSPSSVMNCQTDADCTGKLGTEWLCRKDWNLCVKKDYVKVGAPAVAGCTADSKKGSGANCQGTGGDWCKASGEDGYVPKNQQAEACTAGPEEILGGAKPECVYQINLGTVSQQDQAKLCGTLASCLNLFKITPSPSVSRDDRIEVCVGNCASGSKIYTSPGSTAGSEDPKKDVTSALISGGGSVTISVTDLHAAEGAGTTRGGSAAFTTVVLNPTPVQKCALKPGETKPQLTTLCLGTTQSCTRLGGSACIDCSVLNGEKSTGSTKTSCDGNYQVTTQTMTYYSYSCSQLVTDQNIGAYTTCAGQATGSSQQVHSKTLCKYGCSSGKCKTNSAPTLSSITVDPNEDVKIDDQLLVNSVASDSNTIVSGGSTSGGSGGAGGTGGSCPGGGTPPAGCSCIPDDHSGVCFKCTGRYEAQVSSAVGNVESNNPSLFQGGKVIPGQESAYMSAVAAALTAQGMKAAPRGDEVATRMASDNFDENYDVLISDGTPWTQYTATCNPPQDTAGLAVANPTFDVIITGDAAALPASKKEQIKLECFAGDGSAGGGGTGGYSFSGVCKGGSSPKVELTWTIPSSAVQNVVKRRELPSGSFVEVFSDGKVKTSFTDTNVQMGKSYQYMYKPDPNNVKYANINVSTESCSNATAPTGNVVFGGLFSDSSIEEFNEVMRNAVVIDVSNATGKITIPITGRAGGDWPGCLVWDAGCPGGNCPGPTSGDGNFAEKNALGNPGNIVTSEGYTQLHYRGPYDNTCSFPVHLFFNALGDNKAGGDPNLNGDFPAEQAFTRNPTDITPGQNGIWEFTYDVTAFDCGRIGTAAWWRDVDKTQSSVGLYAVVFNYGRDCAESGGGSGGGSGSGSGSGFCAKGVACGAASCPPNSGGSPASDLHWHHLAWDKELNVLFNPGPAPLNDCSKWYYYAVPESKAEWCAPYTPSPRVPYPGKCPTDSGARCMDGSPGVPCTPGGGGGGAATCQAVSPASILCTSAFADKDPSCTITSIPDAWKTGGSKTVSCYVKDQGGLCSAVKSATITIDGTPPVSTIISPAENSAQVATFPVKAKDIDDGDVDKCYYFITNSDGSKTEDKTRTCNADFTVSVGLGKDCSEHGRCNVSVYATDKSGNKGQPYSRIFSTKFIFTNITSPEDGSYQTRNFTVTVDDRNFVPANVSQMKCVYDVYNISGKPVKTVDNMERNCSLEFEVSVGPEGACNALGTGACKVVSKISAMINGVTMNDTSEKIYSIDWVTPSSRFVTKPTGWIKDDVILFVEDDRAGSNITECQYAVLSNGTETVSWRARTCGAPGNPAELKIKVGAGEDCRNEGGKACQIFVRPLDRAGQPGFSDNLTLAVTFEQVDTDGFRVIGALTTKKGVNFTGMTRQELSVSTFYACNADSTPSSCIDAYNNEDSGIGSENYCGSIMLGGEGRCELRCNDMDADYYFAARGRPLTGPITTVTVVSPINSAHCPTFRIDEINEWLDLFRQLEETLNIQIMMTDEYILLHGESGTANNETLAILREALLLTVDHIDYMEEAILDLDVDKAAEIIRRSEAKLDQINDLLRGITNPTIVTLGVNMPAVVRYNTTTEVPAKVTSTGPNLAYAKVYCTLTKPGGLSLSNRTSCQEIAPSSRIDVPMPLDADTIGTWSYSCTMGRSIRQDCSFEVNSTPVSGTFQVLPGLSVYVSNISIPATVIKGRDATVTASLKNPDDVEKFANVRCDFIDTQQFLRRNTSSCVRIGAGDTSDAHISMTADRLGNWSAEMCTVFASQFPGCENLLLDNVSQESRDFEVTLPTDVYIESVSLPLSPVLNDTTVQMSAIVRNPTTSAAYVIFDCDVSKPAGANSSLAFEGRSGVESGSTSSFTFDMYIDRLGTWNIDSCTTKKSSSPDYSSPVETYSLDNVGSFDVIKGTNLKIVSFTVPSQVASGTNAVLNFNVKNPSNTRYGKVSCSYRSPQNVLLSAASGCSLVSQDATVSMPVSILISSQGVWTVESCSALASIDTDCTSPTTHDTVSPVGYITSSGAVGTQTVALSDVVIENVDATATAFTNTRTNALVTVRNKNQVNLTYAQVSCAFSDPTSVSSRQTSSCYQIDPQSTQLFGVPVTLNAPGTWTVSGCYVNASSSSNCAFSLLYNTSTEVNTIEVTAPSDLYVKTVDATDGAIVNNSDVNINIFIENPLTDDKYGTSTCIIKDPFGGSYTRTTPCVAMPKQTTRTQNVSVFANIVGTWTVSSCNVKSSTNSACTGGTTTGELSNGDLFGVIKGYNLIFSSFSVNNPVYIGTDAKISYTISNPSLSERFAKVVCTVSKGGSSVTNSTPCISIGEGGFFSSEMSVRPSSIGSWDLNCEIDRSLESSCASATLDFSASRTLSVENPPDLYITSVDLPSVVRNKKPFDTVVTIKNAGLQQLYGFVGCTYKNYLNETQTNTSTCNPYNKDTSTSIISFTPSYKGAWNISGCFVNAGNSSDCTNTKRHNLSTFTKTFASTAPLLSIDSISLSSTNLLIGDVIDIAVDVSNNDEISHVGFVNCSVLNPNNLLYKLTSPNQTLQADEVKTFHPKRIVDVAGTWKLVSCSVYSINSPPVLQDTTTLNETFDVVIPEEDLCSPTLPCSAGRICQSGRCVADPNACTISNCPGVREACYCSGDRCLPCGPGQACQNHVCVSETVVANCRSDAECSPGLVCIGGACKEQPPECFLTSDCPSGLECINDKCTAPPSEPLNQDIINLLIIALSAISIPVILFIYIKRVI